MHHNKTIVRGGTDSNKHHGTDGTALNRPAGTYQQRITMALNEDLRLWELAKHLMKKSGNNAVSANKRPINALTTTQRLIRCGFAHALRIIHRGVYHAHSITHRRVHHVHRIINLLKMILLNGAHGAPYNADGVQSAKGLVKPLVIATGITVAGIQGVQAKDYSCEELSQIDIFTPQGEAQFNALSSEMQNKAFTCEREKGQKLEADTASPNADTARRQENINEQNEIQASNRAEIKRQNEIQARENEIQALSSSFGIIGEVLFGKESGNYSDSQIAQAFSDIANNQNINLSAKDREVYMILSETYKQGGSLVHASQEVVNDFKVASGNYMRSIRPKLETMPMKEEYRQTLLSLMKKIIKKTQP